MHCATQLMGAGDLVFDVGAHKGDKTAWFVERGARVIAVEPQPLMAEFLRKRFAGNDRVVVVEKGLSAQPGMLPLKINSIAPTISTFADHWMTGRFEGHTWDREIMVPVSTLDAIILEFGLAKYVKIDVEGLELHVLRGLTQSVELLSFEFTKEFVEEAHKILEYARSIGFSRANLSLGEDEHFTGEWTAIQAFSQRLSNFVAAGPADIWGDIYLRQ